MSYGMTIKEDTGSKRLELMCEHQNGLLYVVPSEASWVCPQEYQHAHALAGFFKELVALEDSRVQALMSRWGIYFRSRPLATQEESSS